MKFTFFKKRYELISTNFFAKLSFQATKPGGVLVVVGMGAVDVKIPLILGLTKEVDIRGCFRYANE